MPVKRLRDVLLDGGLELEEVLDYISWMDEVVRSPRGRTVAPDPGIGSEKRQVIERLCAEYERNLPAHVRVTERLVGAGQLPVAAREYELTRWLEDEAVA